MALLIAIPARALQAQSAAGRLIEQARTQIDGLNPDSAFTLIQSALRQSPNPGERLRAFTLLAFTQLLRDNRQAAGQAFEQALRLDPAMRIDTLADLHSDARLVFGQARQIVGDLPAPRPVEPAAPARLQLVVQAPADTTLAFDNARLIIAIQPNRHATVVSSIAPADAPTRSVWTDTQSIGARTSVSWSLPENDRAAFTERQYILRQQARDSAGVTTSMIEHRLRVARVRPDTQAHPAALPATAFAPERMDANRAGRRRALVAGGAIAVLAAAVPLLLGEPALNDGLASDPAAPAVAGGVAVASVIAFLGGRSRPIPENIVKNRDLRENDRRQREAIAQSNAAMIARAPIRVTVERLP